MSAYRQLSHRRPVCHQDNGSVHAIPHGNARALCGKWPDKWHAPEDRMLSCDRCQKFAEVLARLDKGPYAPCEILKGAKRTAEVRRLELLVSRGLARRLKDGIYTAAGGPV